ncbi:lytic polysaccharide monooxygenase [Kitasatospora purpeofusca]|uniref:lytic polysaccharide monooxygenase auxiliary activity family 9 protein n=1 Tax=Kitasatospora purpeofusca TaxID=67352 RepID=UPI0035E0F9BB
MTVADTGYPLRQPGTPYEESILDAHVAPDAVGVRFRGAVRVSRPAPKRRTVIDSRRKTAAAVVCGTLPLLFVGMTADVAQAHGSMQNPVSRVYACYQEGAESPKSGACQAAIAAGGTQGFYDWMGVRIGDAAGRHRELIPDGKLCSAGNEQSKGLDLARADWPATSLPASGNFTFRYRGTAPHRGSFELYATKDGYDAAKPLKWSDLEPAPFLKASDPPLVNGVYEMTAQLPTKRGRHLIYAIWQRSDSPEAFYSCSDVVFGGAGPGAVPGAGSSPSVAPGTGATAAATPGPTGRPSTGSGPAVAPATGSGPTGRPSTGTAGGAPTPASPGPSNSSMNTGDESKGGTEMGHEAMPMADGASAHPGSTPRTAAAATDSGEKLAQTGASNAAPLAAGAAAVLGAGGTMVFLARRRSHRRV